MKAEMSTNYAAMGKVRPFCRSGLEDKILRPYAAFCLKKLVKRLKAHTITTSTANESPDFLCAAVKILHRDLSDHPDYQIDIILAFQYPLFLQ